MLVLLSHVFRFRTAITSISRPNAGNYLHGHISSSQRLVESNRTASPRTGAQASRWKTTPIRPRLPQGCFVRPSHRHSLADVATRTRVRFGYDLLAAPARLAQAGIWGLIHFVLLDWLCRFGQIDWSRGVVDSCSVRALFGGRRQGRIPLIELSGAASVI